ncbi:AGE family epimerase/isomerase [Microbacterium sp. A93]|uniref:AGE family epimerase/isomerase n=1 Tax=Microbacterium sp. A93 TaxID=3450716 RepID=UPI003F429153
MSHNARQHLEQVIFPFWMQNGIDAEQGGFHTCFDNRGRTRVSEDKYTWSQGRFVWLLARAAALVEADLLDVPGVSADSLVDLSRSGAEFLSRNALRDDGTCAFALSRDGWNAVPGQPDRSVYADLFAAMGFAELASRTGEESWLRQARTIIDRAAADINAGSAPTPPYAVPVGRRAFGPHLILLNALVVLTGAERAVSGSATREELLRSEVDAVMSFRSTGAGFFEMPLIVAGDASDLVSRHRVPGHALEAMWIALEAMELLGTEASTAHRENALAAIAPLCDLGWDTEFGGLFRYTDRDGGRPQGPGGSAPYEDLVRTTWDAKLWWVHSEASAVTAIAARRYGRTECAEWASRIWEYSLDTFPGGAEGAEWVQIRNRDGTPRDEVVALPVKDPFHIARNLMQLVELDAAEPASAPASVPEAMPR